MTEPRVYVDDNNVICFRGILTREEERELEAIARQAFNKGLESGYKQAADLKRPSRNPRCTW